MKKSNLSIIILSALLAIFISLFTGFSVSKNYAENHYEVNYECITSESPIIAGLTYHSYYYGCGENDCKYCNGKKVNANESNGEYKPEYANQFVYYETISAFRITFLVCMILSFIALCITFAVKYKDALIKIFKKV